MILFHNIKMNNNRIIPLRVKQSVVDSQHGKCANFPGSGLWRIGSEKIYENENHNHNGTL